MVIVASSNIDSGEVAVEGITVVQGMSVSHHKPFQRTLFNHPEINARVALDVEAEIFAERFRKSVLDFIADGS